MGEEMSSRPQWPHGLDHWFRAEMLVRGIQGYKCIAELFEAGQAWPAPRRNASHYHRRFEIYTRLTSRRMPGWIPICRNGKWSSLPLMLLLNVSELCASS